MLSVIEGRVLGCLMEKERTVPDQYPLTMNALVSACNQSSSCEPIMALDDFEVDASITSMKAQGLLRIVHPSHGRSVTRYRQVAVEKYELDEGCRSGDGGSACPWSTDSRRASLTNRAAAWLRVSR